MYGRNSPIHFTSIALFSVIVAATLLALLTFTSAWRTNQAWLAFLHTAFGPADTAAHATALSRMTDLAAEPAAQPRDTQALAWLQHTSTLVEERAAAAAAAPFLAQLRALVIAGTVPDSAQITQLETLAAQQNRPEAMLLLLQIAQMQGDAAEVARRQQALLDYTPQHPLNPPLAVGDWHLEGYDVALPSFSPMQTPQVVLFWRAPKIVTPAAQPEQGIYPVADRILQLVDAPNAILNGDFEWMAPADAALPPLWRLIPPNPGDEGRVFTVALEAAPDGGQAAALSADAETLIYMLQNLQPATPYLLLGDLQTESNAILAVMQSVDGVNQWPAIIRPQPAPASQSVAALLQTAQPQPVTLYWGVAQSPQEIRRLAIDNLLLIPVQPPFPFPIEEQ